MAKKAPLEIHGIAGSQLMDTQGETLSVEGADIDNMVKNGRFNDNHSNSFYNTLGRITEAKKIFGPEDCTNEHHRYFYDKVKCPYIYVRGLLFDNDDHPNARAAAAIIRNIHKADTPLKCKFSVEGGVVQRGIKDPSLLARTKITNCALTFTPANNATLVEPLSLEKCDTAADMALIKSVLHLAQEDVPSFRSITRDAQAEKVMENLVKMQEIAAQLGITVDIDVGNKDELIQKSIENKIADNVKKINEMVAVLNKAAPKLSPLSGIPEGTHDVEVHPDMDHLYHAKQHVVDSGRDRVKIGYLKNKGLPSDVINKVPRDAQGWTSAKQIDDHIDSLPKRKLRIEVAPYEWGQQLHHPDSEQHVLSVGLHPDEKLHEDPTRNSASKHIFNHMYDGQHTFDGIDEDHNQFGWARVDATAKPGHWHVDELQSDFQNHKKISSTLKTHPGLNLSDSEVDKYAKDLHEDLSHGHNDPQHLIHSAVNAMARKHGANSISMDTPSDQARQSALRQFEDADSDDIHNNIIEQIADGNHQGWNRDLENWKRTHLSDDELKRGFTNTNNPHLKSAFEKFGEDTLDKLKDTAVDSLLASEPHEKFAEDLTEHFRASNDYWHRSADSTYANEATKRQLKSHKEAKDRIDLTEQEHDAIRDHFIDNILYNEEAPYLDRYIDEAYNAQQEDQERPNRKASKLPVHQIDTYRKRPRKLGMKNVPKKDVMPDHTSRDDQEIQYSKVYKNIQEIHGLVKALTAGYGGAGAPTNLTGGGVFQSESVEGSRGFSYITCHKCGKEEIYHDKQVKYRCCGRSIPFEDLFYAISKK